MKIVNHKTLTSALFAFLIFSVAVSGGCGGGSGNSISQDTVTLPDGFTAEYASPDLQMSAPEELSSDDVFISEDASNEYGAGEEINAFVLLTKTTWRIGDMAVLDANGDITTCRIDRKKGNNYNIDTVTFLTSGRALAWARDRVEPDDFDDSKKTPIYDDLTVTFQDEDENQQTAPILRPGNFTETAKNYTYRANVAANTQSGIGRGTETIGVLPENSLVPTRLSVTNKFTAANGRTYQFLLNLDRVDNFLILDQTDWQVKNVQVFGMVRGADGSYTYGNPQNYVVTDNEYQNYKMTLYTTVRNNRRFFEYRYYPAGVTRARLRDHTLMFKFRDNTINQELSAPFLRSGGGFEFKGKQGTFDVIEGILKDCDVPGNEVLQVSEYGPNSYVFIDNSVYYRDQNNVDYHYWVRTTLEPTYIPDN